VPDGAKPIVLAAHKLFAGLRLSSQPSRVKPGRCRQNAVHANHSGKGLFLDRCTAAPPDANPHAKPRSREGAKPILLVGAALHGPAPIPEARQ
jgi:hypothetical protein